MSKSGSEKRARNFTVTTRATEDEKNAIKARANAHGLSIGAFIREVTLDRPLPKSTRFTKDQGQFVALVLSSLGAMMDHVKKLNEGRYRQAAALSLHRELLRLRDQCFEVLGRKL